MKMPESLASVESAKEYLTMTIDVCMFNFNNIE